MSEAKCPVAHGANSNMEKSSTDWWPKNLNLDILHQHDQKTKPFNGTYNYSCLLYTSPSPRDS